MQLSKPAGNVIHSASDLCSYLSCEYLAARNYLSLTEDLERAQDADDAKLIQRKGLDHEAAHLARLKQDGLSVVEIAKGSIAQMAEATLNAMHQGVDIIFQATFVQPNFSIGESEVSLLGYADFLQRVPGDSSLGNFHYEVVDTKLAKTTKAKFLVQLIFYSELLALLQGVYPKRMHVVTGRDGGRMESHETARYRGVVRLALKRYAVFIESETARISVKPEPCDHCSLCGWRDHCDKRWIDEDHLSRVANISKLQIAKLRKAGISTRGQLATKSLLQGVSDISSHSLARLHEQASLQIKGEETGRPIYVLLPVDDNQGLGRLPEPHPEDLYFDMEGNPLEEGGSLEYLFGLYHAEWGFKAFWALNRQEEKSAFEAFMDFVSAHLAKHPGAHVYHYAAYEQTALKRLMTQYGTREAQVDHLLRHGLLVDLYHVVREGIRVSEPKYSIKNLERFYWGKRQGDVTNAGASIIFFERWKETGEQKLLDDIELYNKDDVHSTMDLHRWLVSLRPASQPWRLPSEVADDSSKSLILESEAKLQARISALMSQVSALPESDPKHQVHVLLCNLLDFHRRADKPVWWAMFERMKYSADQLEDDMESIYGLRRVGEPVPDKRSNFWRYEYPEQQTKLRSGSEAYELSEGKTIKIHSLNEDSREVVIRLGNKHTPADFLSLGPGGPLNNDIMKSAIQRLVDDYIHTGELPGAVRDLLYRSYPRMKHIQPQQKLLTHQPPQVDEISNVVAQLDASVLFIQGPPGTGKTYTGSKVIVDQMQRGLVVGVLSNSHHAIHNLLSAVEREADHIGYTFSGIKKCNKGQPDSHFSGRHIVDVPQTAQIESMLSNVQLIAGTAWLFARPEFVGFVDTLFVDEAGQVALANLIACMPAATNVVLLGDQMQLAQPIQGAHPGESGLSGLDYLLDGQPTIAPERGVFLSQSWRMAPPITDFISGLVYEGRLTCEPNNGLQHIHWGITGSIARRSQGIETYPVVHHSNGQQSPEEAEALVLVYTELLASTWTNRDGVTEPISANDILVVAPYNLQVQLLKRRLPADARVGTVDKFQGQEAAAVLISMATSSQEYLPRDIEFLFSTNRLNVAITRGRAYVGFFYSPDLLLVKTNTPESMALVNTVSLLAEQD